MIRIDHRKLLHFDKWDKYPQQTYLREMLWPEYHTIALFLL